MLKKEKILIADDSEEVLIYTTMSVESMGYEAIKAENGKEAIDLVNQHKPDLIILDWKMPEMDGLEATKQLKNNPKTKDIPIIMITGTNESSEFMAEALEMGVNDFIRKPFDKIELQARIKSLLKQAKYQQQIIENKNKELTHSIAQLTYTIDFQNIILAKLENLSKNTDDQETKNIINELISKIKVNDKFNPIKNLHKNYISKNNNFTTSLLSKHTNLTSSEIKLCMLLRQHLDTKEIAGLVYQTYDSVRVSRNRLRKKLNLVKTDNLANYLMMF